MVFLDGAYGEGGGQILRTALSLSILMGKPVKIEDIRANRKKPGLMPQHLTVVKALQKISSAETEGAMMESTGLIFKPGETRSGKYLFDVGTAGSTSLILQAILPPLAFGPGKTQVILKGGTHVPWSPPFHYLEKVFIPVLSGVGVRADLTLVTWGWYPRGGGEVRIEIEPARTLHSLRLVQSWKPESLKVLCASSNLPAHITDREKNGIRERLSREGLSAEFEVFDGPSPGQGNMVFIAAGSGVNRAGFTALGERGKRAEQVADEAVDALLSFLNSGAAVEEHLADQLVPYLALAEGPSELLVQHISSHLRTNLWVVEHFIKRKIQLDEEGSLGRLTIK
jgi:RNA 3'-terminal phosphate cyclase (ATP)